QTGVRLGSDWGQTPFDVCSSLYRPRIVGIKYSLNARPKSYRGEKFQSLRAAESSTSAGHVSTIAWRLTSTLNEMSAAGNDSRTTSRISSADGLKAPTLYAVRRSLERSAAASVSSASTPSGIAMNGMRGAGRTKHEYESACAAAGTISGA